MIAIMKFFDAKAFIISLAIGMFFVYISSPEPQILYIYPTPDNVDKILYKDKTDTCYKFTAKEVKCPVRASKIMKYPIQSKIEGVEIK
jgi:hypothetical protein